MIVITSSPCPSRTLFVKALRVAVVEPLDVVHPLLVKIEVPVIPTGILGDLFASFVLQVLLSTSIRSASASLFEHIKAPFNYNVTGDVGTAPTYSGSKPDSLLLG